MIRKFRDFVGDAVLVGHNITSCDIPYITKAAKRAGVAFDNAYFDTYRYAKTLKELPCCFCSPITRLNTQSKRPLILMVPFYPPGMESVPRRYAIVRANRYMIDHVDYLIAYARHPASNARSFLDYAQKKAIPFLNLADCRLNTAYHHE